MYKRANDTEIFPAGVTLSGRGLWHQQDVFSNVAIESAAEETFAASTLPTALAAVAT